MIDRLPVVNMLNSGHVRPGRALCRLLSHSDTGPQKRPQCTGPGGFRPSEKKKMLKGGVRQKIWGGWAGETRRSRSIVAAEIYDVTYMRALCVGWFGNSIVRYFN